MGSSLPPCGLYRTTEDLVEHPNSVGPNLLVYFHNHSDQGPPMVALPDANAHNRWRFKKAGFSIERRSYIDSLVPLKPEGLYRLRGHFHPDDERVVAANSLVQLGYNRAAEPILFFPKVIEGENGFVFPVQGMRVGSEIYDLLEPLDVRGPARPRKLH